MKLFYTYVDTTYDDCPFYVGKGNRQRVCGFERNDVWLAIVKKHGHKRRIVVFETPVEQWAFDREIELIALLKTNMNRLNEGHWGANLTDGGEGCSGYKHTDDARKKMQLAKVGWKPSPELLKKAYDANLGRRNSADAIKRTTNANRGRKRSLETRERLSLSHMHRIDRSHPDAAPKNCMQCNEMFFISPYPLTASRLKAHVAKRFCGRKCARTWCNIQGTGKPRSEDVKKRISKTLSQTRRKSSL